MFVCQHQHWFYKQNKNKLYSYITHINYFHLKHSTYNNSYTQTNPATLVCTTSSSGESANETDNR